MELTKETLELLQKTAVDAAGAQQKAYVRDIGAIVPDHYLLVAGDQVTLVQRPRPQRWYSLVSLSEVVPFCAWGVERLSANPVIWFDGDVLDIPFHPAKDSGPWSDGGSLRVSKTSAFELLERLAETPTKHSQKDFVRVLRMEFQSALGTAANSVIAACRAIRFSESQRGQSTVSNGRQSLGRELESEVVADVGTIPETLEFRLPVYMDPLLQMPATILCDLEVNPLDQTFTLTPFPGQVEAALDKLSDVVRAVVADAGVPFFRGTDSE